MIRCFALRSMRSANLWWLIILSAAPQPLRSENEKQTTNTKPQQAIDRAIAFIKEDAINWRKDHECATCHHGTFTVWVLSEAQARGDAIDDESYDAMVKWTKERLDRIDLPRDDRPGWNMMSTPALYLALMAQVLPGQRAISAEEDQRIADHLLRHQEADGSWAWSSAPAKNRPPPFFESDEVATLIAVMTLKEPKPAEPPPPTAIHISREKALAWLAKVEPADTTQAAAFRLWLNSRGEAADATMPAEINRFLARQNADGGWSQVQDRPSDAYATGQALYVLNQVGVPPAKKEIQRGVAFLVDQQKEDGSWPMTRRGHPGVTPGEFIVPITYFGSAWATLGLLRSVPK